MRKFLLILLLIYFASCVLECNDNTIPETSDDCKQRSRTSKDNWCCYVEHKGVKRWEESTSGYIQPPDSETPYTCNCFKENTINTNANNIKIRFILLFALFLL